MRFSIIVFCIAYLSGCGVSDQTERRIEEAPRPAKIITVNKNDAALTYEFPGRVEALQSVDISFEVGGPLSQLPIREGSTLPPGALVAAIDPTDFNLAVQEAQVQLRLAAQDLNRKQKVLKENGIAKSQVEDARSLYELQRVRLSKARERLQDSRITAPFEAFVSHRYFDRHVNIRPGEPIARLLDLRSLQVVFNAPEKLLANRAPNGLLEAWAEFSFAPGEKFELTYYENRGEAESLAQTYAISLIMENPERWNILPGMTATINLKLKSDSGGVIVVPASAIVPTPNNSLSVWIYAPDSQLVSQRVIDAGPLQAGGIPVQAGLESGEQIVVTGANHLRAGMRVRPL